ncbi:IS3 family transposase [Catalinimonas sp. 4WD22]|uniref:IS3 family transposase n=1 Tax=Catalinimonas locisalis TaxID=3133978 RepID=UPI003100C304
MRYPLKGLQVLCGLFGLTRYAYYKAIKQKHLKDDIEEEIIAEVKDIREKLPRVGTLKLHYMMVSFRQENGIKCGRDKLHEILKKRDMLVKTKALRAKTTYSEHGYRKFENLTQDFEPSRINELWVSDITYIRTGNRFSYLSLITDAFSRKIIGWNLHPTLHARGPLMALDMALCQKEDDSPTPLIHHSDRGIQYCCHQYIHLLENNEIMVSMTESPDPYENALAERTNLTLKHEFLLESGFPSFHQAYHATKKAIHNYNHLRPHVLCYLTKPFFQIFYHKLIIV